MLPVHAQEVLGVAQDMPKVNVEEVPCQVQEAKAIHQPGYSLMAGSRSQKHAVIMVTVVCDHDVVVVPVPYAQHVGGHAVTSAGLDESRHGCVVLRSGNSDQSGLLLVELSYNEAST